MTTDVDVYDFPVTGDVLTWDLNEVATAMRIGTDAAVKLFRDGRPMSFLLECRIQHEFPKWIKASSGGASFDLMDPNRGLWEVKTLTKNVAFAPNKCYGVGRSFDESVMVDRLKEMTGFIVGDAKSFPSVKLFVISVDEVLERYRNGRLGSAAKLSRESFLVEFGKG